MMTDVAGYRKLTITLSSVLLLAVSSALCGGCGTKSTSLSAVEVSGGTGGVDGVRIADFPWVSYTAGDDEMLRIVEIELEEGALKLTWGPSGGLEVTRATVTPEELEQGRALFTDEQIADYAQFALPADAGVDAEQRLTRLVIDSGRGESPAGYLFHPTESTQSSVVDMFGYFELLYESYRP